MKKRVRMAFGFFCVLTLIAFGIILVLSTGKDAWFVFGPMKSEAIFLIDAGHGGMDGGASSANGVNEKDINLFIAKKVDALMPLFGLSSSLTREEDISFGYHPNASIRNNKINDLHTRLELVQQTPNAVFLSIHLNKFEDSKYKGAQVFYSVNHADSQVLAELLQEELVAGLDRNNNRKAKSSPDGIFLLKNIVTPAVIVECGFLSNPEEEQLLQEDEYQKRIALSIVSGALRYIKQ